ncbi:hypothetical protein CA85_48810 [Allorhodopirellula solitaria]|uniref:Uncharacterized protein n=1 Tax=Allorhodopirellula solitaria TaxID=2527987 RepID=A0A5C5WY47_9BACT|nr:hypothetical protein CA85_48810 [Allorhodopirellula solitaria]
MLPSKATPVFGATSKSPTATDPDPTTERKLKRMTMRTRVAIKLLASAPHILESRKNLNQITEESSASVSRFANLFGHFNFTIHNVLRHRTQYTRKSIR